MSSIESLVADSVQRLMAHPRFSAWRASDPLKPGDVVLINNSFVFRDVKTNKAELYLALMFKEDSDEPDVTVASGTHINADFKRVARASANLLSVLSLADAIQPQIAELGHLLFLLIGHVEDNVIVQAKLNHGSFSTVMWDPAMAETARIEEDRIVIRRTDDEELVWNAIAATYDSTGSTPPENLRDAVGVALDHLQDQAEARVRIPIPGESNAATGITDAILTVLREQRDAYCAAIGEYAQDATAYPSALNDVLRIAYNFSSDATGFLRLIVSVCDLKPIVLWGTIAEHHALSDAFHALPWARSNRKPSLKNYQQSIADARNSAFHNLFPFRKSLRVRLPEGALGLPELHIFSEHAKKSSNQLTYRDKELVDVLLEFTRARDRSLSLSFWLKNLDVMDTTLALFERTNEFVKELAMTRSA